MVEQLECFNSHNQQNEATSEQTTIVCDLPTTRNPNKKPMHRQNETAGCAGCFMSNR